MKKTWGAALAADPAWDRGSRIKREVQADDQELLLIAIFLFFLLLVNAFVNITAQTMTNYIVAKVLDMSPRIDI